MSEGQARKSVYNTHSVDTLYKQYIHIAGYCFEYTVYTDGGGGAGGGRGKIVDRFFSSRFRSNFASKSNIKINL